MSTVPFHDTVTLYTQIEEGFYERQVISSVKTIFADGDSPRECRSTVYIPIFGRRSLRYEIPSKRRDFDRGTFTVKAGQYIIPGICPDAFPPDSAQPIRRVNTYLSGSRRLQHIRIIAYKKPLKEEEE